MKPVGLLCLLLAGPAAAMTVPPPNLEDPAVRARLESESCVLTFQTCVTRIDGNHITNNCDIRISSCEEEREQRQVARRPATARVLLRGSAADGLQQQLVRAA